MLERLLVRQPAGLVVKDITGFDVKVNFVVLITRNFE